MDDDPRARKDALAFLTRHKTGVLATAGHDNIPHASAIHYYADNDFNIYFLTLASSRKYHALSAHPQVAFAVTREDMPQTLQIEGMAKDIMLDRDIQEKRQHIVNTLNADPLFPLPITRLHGEKKVVVWIRPTWIRWADYASAQPGTEHVFKEIPVE